ncbi:hypothetical protein Dsin_004997 [Dipteronia sinensis]|uniref:AMP-dependent synthetase/ligase domain-containing protein n=1 Tax=Dipteronia sinensis TaxID=43782 RepID=A0AAE0AWM6_9ROSI|nr:hypothetical protein Dsin_004997 [Dipteronia sinensis]
MALSLKKHYSVSKGDVAFILSFHSFHFPILYFALLPLGVIISPAMPDESISDVNRLVNLCKPTIAFTTSQSSHKLPSHLPTVVLLDSPEFLNSGLEDRDVISQNDGAAIFCSSVTSDPRKGTFLTHRNLIVAAATAQSYHIPSDISDQARALTSTPAPVSLTTRLLTAVFGSSVMMRAVLMGETLVLIESNFEIEQVLEAVDKYKG